MQLDLDLDGQAVATGGLEVSLSGYLLGEGLRWPKPHALPHSNVHGTGGVLRTGAAHAFPRNPSQDVSDLRVPMVHVPLFWG